MQTTLHNSRSLLTTLTNDCHLPSGDAAALSPASVAKGSGHACCVVLNYVLDLALQRKGMASLSSPKYNDAVDTAYDEGEYFKRRRACIAYMENIVVDISIPPPSFKPVAFVFVTYLLYI